MKTPKEVLDKFASLFDNKYDPRIYHLENELISLHPSNFETLNDFFTKFKHMVFQFKMCKVEKEDDQIILSILSKIGEYYLVFVSAFHTDKLTKLNWNIPTLNAFIESFTNEHEKLV